jgi:signal transduction histidine kinase
MIVNAAHAIADVVGQEGTAKGSITIRTRREDDHVVVTIADTGAGMTEEVRQRIFDPFFTTKEVGKGTGQGLAIAHSVIHDKHGGRITVESAPGEGTAFHIALPLDSAVPVPEHKTSCVA